MTKPISLENTEIDDFYPIDFQLNPMDDLQDIFEAACNPLLPIENQRPYPVKQISSWEMEELPNFTSVSQTLYRGGLPTEEGFKILVQKGVKTLISFRKADVMHSLAKECGLNAIVLPWDAGNPESITKELILTFLKIATDVNQQPVFNHCTYGADRTGFMSAVYRLVVERANMETAMGELTLFQSEESEFLQPALIERLKTLDVYELRQVLGLS